ncbi:MAG: hypothetical protein IPG63_15175 [Xanthomonadales bacterium]|nr:hypothetical protein [Xanthomonadales bacterium]
MREARALGAGDAHFGQGLGSCRQPAPVDVDLRQRVLDADDLDHAAVVGRCPRSRTEVVPACRHALTHRKAEEIVDVETHRLRKLHTLGANSQRLVGRQLHRIGVGRCRRQLPRHALRPTRAHRVLGGTEVQHRHRYLAPIGQRHRRFGSGREEHARLARTVFVENAAARNQLRRRGGTEHHCGHLRIERDHAQIIDQRPVTPGGAELALHAQPVRLLEVEDQVAAAIDQQVVMTVEAAVGVAELGMIEDAHQHAGQRLSVFVEHAPAQDRRAVALDQSLRQPALDRLRTKRDELAHIEKIGGDGGIDRGRDNGGIGRHELLDAGEIEQAVVVGIALRRAVLLAFLEAAAKDAVGLCGNDCRRAGSRYHDRGRADRQRAEAEHQHREHRQPRRQAQGMRARQDAGVRSGGAGSI